MNKPSTCTCGGIPEVKSDNQSHYAEDWVKCPACGLQGTPDFSYHTAIRNWNRMIKSRNDRSK